MKRYIALAVLLAILLSFTACSEKIKSVNLTEKIKKEPSSTDAQYKEGDHITDLGAKLLSHSYEGDNILLSPLSVMCALAMVQNGAEGNTKSQMEEVLGAPSDELNSYVLGYCNSLPSNEKNKVSIANSVWIRNCDALTVKPDFLQAVTDFFKTDVYKSDFDKRTVKDINIWVKESTNGMIPSIIDDIPDETMMFLINALSFEAEWEDIYEKSQVRDDVFYLENGKTETVDFMFSGVETYLEDDNTTGFIKYYHGRDYAFAALLPNNNIDFSEYIEGLTGEKITNLFDNSTECTVYTSIPKFETEYSSELSETLKRLGMPDAFDPFLSDLSDLGSFENDNLYISSVLHKTYICVAEKGTKAGAVTSVSVDATGAPAMEEEPKKVFLDRPFLYMIIDCKTNTPIFIGILTQP